MAYTNITSQLASNGNITVNGVGYFFISNPYNGAYGFAASAHNGTTYLASQNLNVDSSAAGMRLNFSLPGTNGVNIKISYIISAETSYDYAMFSKSGTTMASSCTYTSSEVYHHTRGIYGANESAITYYIPSESYIDIMYKKDSSVAKGIDRLLVKIEVEAVSGGGGGGGDTLYYFIATKIRPVGKENENAGTYVLPSTATTGYTINIGTGDSNGDIQGDLTVITSGNYKIGWISGITSTDGGVAPGGGQTTLVFSFDGVYGHRDSTNFGAYAMFYINTTQQLYNPQTITNSLTVVDIVHYQYNYSVYIGTDSGGNDAKAYYTVAYGSPFNETIVTGKNGYVNKYSSATTGSVSVTITRTGSNQVNRTFTRPISTTYIQPTSSSDKIVTSNDLWAFNSSLGNAYSSTSYLCLKHNSTIFDSNGGVTNKLRHIHDFLHFAGTPDTFQDSGSTPSTPTGYEVNANAMTMSWSNSGPSNLVVQALTIYAGSTGTINDDILYSLVQSKTLTAGDSGSFTIPVVNDSVENVTYLTVSITCANYASLTISLNTQSNGAIGCDLQPGSGTATKQIVVTSDLTITGGSLNCSYATG